MKMIKRVAMSAAALVFIGSSVFAQSLADAKKAIDAEQYQKAKTMLKNLTVTQPTKDENFFYLGWVYLIQDYSDSAKVQFNKGIAVNPKSALNYAGLGGAALLDKDQAGATSNFNQALTLAGKDSKPYLYVGSAYLLTHNGGVVSSANANAAISVLQKGKTVNPKVQDAELMVVLGNAYLSQLKSNDAFQNYRDALSADPKSVTANVAEGVLWRLANNWESSVEQFKAALAIDPNFGPAYREWAETDYRQARADVKVASEKIKEAVDYYRKYLSLTDMSLESQMRYADFLVNAGDYKTLQEVTTQLAKYANSNLRVYRYMGYAAYENKDYPAANTALTKFIKEAGEARVIPRDYLYLGRTQIASGSDSLGIQSLRKAYQMDTTQADVFLEIAKNNYAKKKYLEAGNAYQEYFDKSHKGTLNEHLASGISYFYAFDPNNPKADTMLLTKADSAFSYIEHKATSPVAPVILYRAYVADTKDADRNNIKGLAKPYYDRYIALVGAKPTLTDQEKKSLAAAYVYLARIYEYKDKDDAKTLEAYNKAKEYDPANKEMLAYFSRKPGAGGKAK
jgi:Tfp pilus assembly protein PilF